MALAALRSRNASLRFPNAVVLVVGGTSGLGRACAVRLADAGFQVFVVGRDAARGQEVVASLATSSDTAGPHAFVQCDASRIAAVRACARDVASRTPRLDVLVLSQGIATIQGRTPTDEGLDVKMSLHYFSRVAFILELLPLLRSSPMGGRVLSVLSAGVHGQYAHWSDDFELQSHYSIKNAADAAGFYTDAALDSLSRDPANAGVRFVHQAPGFVATSWGTEMPLPVRGLVRVLQSVFAKKPGDAAEFLVDGLLRKEPEKGGLLLLSETGGAAKPVAAHEAARDGIWNKTLERLGRIA